MVQNTQTAQAVQSVSFINPTTGTRQTHQAGNWSLARKRKACEQTHTRTHARTDTHTHIHTLAHAHAHTHSLSQTPTRVCI